MRQWITPTLADKQDHVLLIIMKQCFMISFFFFFFWGSNISLHHFQMNEHNFEHATMISWLSTIIYKTKYTWNQENAISRGWGLAPIISDTTLHPCLSISNWIDACRFLLSTVGESHILFSNNKKKNAISFCSFARVPFIAHSIWTCKITIT